MPLVLTVPSLPFRRLLRLILGLWLMLTAATVALAQTWGRTPEVQALAGRLAAQQALPEAWVLDRLANARFLDHIPALMLPGEPGQRKNWAAYRNRFIEPQRIRAGVKFWREHRKTLQRASDTYQVPAWLIVGVLGVETLYGRHMGKIAVLDALTTLSLAFPPEHPRAAERQAFFEKELGVFLRQGRTQPEMLAAKGSYAGAMGWGQFMPSSIERFAVDFDGDGRIDLIRSVPDAIGSIAHYFQQHGWKPGLRTHYDVTVNSTAEQLDTLLIPDILPTFSLQRLNELGLLLPPDAKGLTGPLALVELQNGDAPNSYVVGTENFYAVTRYNWSSYYAMAVIELGHVVQTTERRTRAKRHSE